jgi:hypothetical protein
MCSPTVPDIEALPARWKNPSPAALIYPDSLETQAPVTWRQTVLLHLQLYQRTVFSCF